MTDGATAPPDRPRTLYRRARLAGHPGPAALLVEDGAFAWLGDDEDAPVDPALTVVDLDGALVLPAFVDAHVHTTDTGLAISSVDLRGVGSLAEALDAVAAASRAARGRPVLGLGWDDQAWPEHRPPTARELDRASYGGVVYLARQDLHSAVVSSALMAAVPGLAGLAGYRPDGWMGEPDAHDAVRRAATAALTAGQRRDAQRAALRAAAALGVAAVHEMAGPAISSETDFTDLLALARDEALPEVVGYWGELHAVAKARELGAVGAAGDLFCDGSLGSGTAALHEPYADRDSTGWVRYEVDEIAAHVEACLDAGLQAGFHAIGDAAVDQVVEAFERVSRRRGVPAGRGHRVEHAEYVRDPARLAATGLTASMQPVFDALWGGTDGLYAERLGPTRALALNRGADLAAAGVPLVFGSDSPVTELGPWPAVAAAAHHHDPSASLGYRAAFDAHTVAGWTAAGRPGEGVLAVGRPATFAAWRLADGAPVREGLPDAVDGPVPVCVRTVHAGRTLHAA